MFYSDPIRVTRDGGQFSLIKIKKLGGLGRGSRRLDPNRAPSLLLVFSVVLLC